MLSVAWETGFSVTTKISVLLQLKYKNPAHGNEDPACHN